ncbi:DUF4333 domain-containing protein [Nocardia sp. KC 131]|uniref:DUF4333 domain-containing protein n=1 Tax=Nocardia arseniciresistens TaxID=3392119 RepID=UPI00398F6F7B
MISVLVCVVVGCSVEVGSKPEIKEANLENQVKKTLIEKVGQKPDAIDCPGGLEGKVGTTMRCTLTKGKDTIGLTLNVTEVDGDNVKYDIKVDNKR